MKFSEFYRLAPFNELDCVASSMQRSPSFFHRRLPNAFEYPSLSARGDPGREGSKHGIVQRAATLAGFIALEANLLALSVLVPPHAWLLIRAFIRTKETATRSRSRSIKAALAQGMIDPPVQGFDLFEKHGHESRPCDRVHEGAESLRDFGILGLRQIGGK